MPSPFSFIQKKIKQPKTFKQKFILVCIVALLGILLAGALRDHFYPRGAVSKGEVVRLYLHYLSTKDSYSLQRLTPKGFNNQKEILNLMKELGGNTFENVAIDFKSSESSSYWYVTIKGTRIDSNGKKITFAKPVNVQQLGISNFDDSGKNRWYIMLGTYKSSLQITSSPLKIEEFK